MSEYYYGKPENTGSWEQTASIFAAHESLNSEKTSSLPLVQFWKWVNKSLPENIKKFASRCNIPEEEMTNSKLYFEYPVSVQPTEDGVGRGKASMTDLMILTNNYAIAVEAKWTECKNLNYGDKCDTWLKNGKQDYDANRIKVLNGWLSCINSHCSAKLSSAKLTIDSVKDTPYQLIHRISSACVAAKSENGIHAKTPLVVYHLFHDAEITDKTNKFASNLKEWFEELSIANIQFAVLKTEIKEGFPICVAEEELNELFIKMQKESLYTFGETLLSYIFI